MIDVYVRRSETINLGREGTKGVRRIIFDYTRWVRTYGEGVVQLIVQRPGETQPYPVALTYENDEAIWEVNDADTAIVGDGLAEYQYYADGKLEKSEIFNTKIIDALGVPTDEPPEPYDVWLAALLEVASDAQQSAWDAEESRQGAESAEAGAVAAQTAAEAAQAESERQAGIAAGHAEAAEDAQAKAEAARDAAKQSEDNAAQSESNAARSESNAAQSADNAAASAATAGAHKDAAAASAAAAEEAEAAAQKSAEDAAELVANADWLDLEIDEYGDLIFTCADSFTTAEFAITENGDLEVTYT